MSRRIQQLSSRTQTLSTRPPRPPSYEEATVPELVQEEQVLLNSSRGGPTAPPPSEIGQEQNLNGDIRNSPVFGEHYWTSEAGPSIPVSENIPMSRRGNVGAPSEDLQPQPLYKNSWFSCPNVPWKPTVVYGFYIGVVTLLVTVYTAYLILVNRKPTIFTVLVVIFLYAGVGFLFWVCYVVLKSVVQRYWNKE